MNKTFLAAILALPLLFGACSTTSPSTTQVITDVQNVVNAAQIAFTNIVADDPTLLTAAQVATVKADLATASALAGGLSTGLSTVDTANTVQQINGDINAVLATLAAVSPAVVAQYPNLAPAELAIQAIDTLAPTLETFVDTALGLTPTSATGAVSAKLPAMSVDKARSILVVYTAKH